MVLRIDRTTEGEFVVMTLSGHVALEELADLRRLLAAESEKTLIVDLTDVIQVDRDAVALLASVEAGGVQLRHCPAYVRAAPPPGALPETMFTTKHVLHLNHETIVLQCYAPAHTDSDISVHFTETDVFHVGDTWWNGLYPFIDYSTGGSIAGTIRAAEANVAAVGSDTVVIPGHGPVGAKPQLIEFRDMLVAIHDKVAVLKKQGRSLEDVVAAKPTALYDAKWGDFPINGSAFASLVYAGV